MKLLILLSKRPPPSTRIRFCDSIPYWKAKGAQVTAMPIPSDPLGRLTLLRQARQNDVVLLHKRAFSRGLELSWLRRVNPNIVFDVDDAVMFPESENNKPLRGKRFFEFIRTIDYCAAVVVGNRFLAYFTKANCPNTHILPTPVDMSKPILRDWNKSPEVFVVGWLGLANNLRYLKKLKKPLQSLVQRFPQFCFKIISNDFIDIPGVPCIKEIWTQESQASALASLDVGLMPLTDDLWSWGKCGYKILQYFSAGVPAVASPVGINTEFVQPGVTGYLADEPQAWEACLIQLLEQRSLCQQLGSNGYRMVSEEYSQERFAERYFNVIKNLFKNNILI